MFEERTSKLIVCCLGLGLLVLVWFVLSVNEIIDPFLYPRLAYAELIRHQDRLEILTLDRTTLGRPGYEQFYELLIIVIIKITGISAAHVAFLPLGGIFVACTYFAVSRRFFRSNAIAFMLTLALMLEPPLVQGIYNVYYLAWALPIYLVSTLLFINLLTKQRARTHFILLLLFYFDMQYIHPTPALWLTALPLSFLIASMVGRVRSSALQRRSVLMLFLGFVIIYVVTGNWFYFYLETAKSRGVGLSGIVGTILQRITSALFRSPDFGGTVSIQEISSPEVARLQLAYHIITVVPVVLYFFMQLLKGITKKGRSKLLRYTSSIPDLFVWVGVTTSLLTVLGYWLVAGYPGTKYNLFFFPIVATLAIYILSKKSRRIVSIFLLVLLVVNAGKFALTSGEMLTGSHYSSTQIGAEWVLKNGSQNNTILSDFRTSGVIALRWSTDQYVASNVRSITIRLYDCLLTSDYTDPACSVLSSSNVLLAVDEKALQRPFYADNWQYVPPLSSLLENKTFNRIYDGKIIVSDISISSKRP